MNAINKIIFIFSLSALSMMGMEEKAIQPTTKKNYFEEYKKFINDMVELFQPYLNEEKKIDESSQDLKELIQQYIEKKRKLSQLPRPYTVLELSKKVYYVSVITSGFAEELNKISLPAKENDKKELQLLVETINTLSGELHTSRSVIYEQIVQTAFALDVTTDDKQQKKLLRGSLKKLRKKESRMHKRNKEN